MSINNADKILDPYGQMWTMAALKE